MWTEKPPWSLSKSVRCKWGRTCYFVAFLLSFKTHIELCLLSLDFAEQALIYSIYSYFPLESQPSLVPELFLLCVFLNSEFPSLFAFIFLAEQCLKLNTISWAFEKGLCELLIVKTSPGFWKLSCWKQWTHSVTHLKSHRNCPFYFSWVASSPSPSLPDVILVTPWPLQWTNFIEFFCLSSLKAFTFNIFYFRYFFPFNFSCLPCSVTLRPLRKYLQIHNDFLPRLSNVFFAKSSKPRTKTKVIWNTSLVVTKE